jgi:hypothetical protein
MRNANWIKFKGRQMEKQQTWLRGRLHFIVGPVIESLDWFAGAALI